jgi:putative transposase
MTPVLCALINKFSVATLNAKWSADITYVWTCEGWLYLAVILDLFSRRVVGWATGKSLERSLVLSALAMAQAQRKPLAYLLCYSDRGSQDASHDYQKVLTDAKIVCSMSRKGDWEDNAPTESFFATLKKELLHRRKFASWQEAKTALFGWIEGWYNRKHRHSSLGYLSPQEYERQHR